MNLVSSTDHAAFAFCALSLLVLLVSSASDSELQSLLEFKKGIQTDPLNLVNGSWVIDTLGGPNACPSSWSGVYCDENGNISAIVLDQRGLSGELKFHTLIGLKMLRNLSLSGNNFTGRLVPAFGTMTSLQHLDLSGNSFYGPIPRRFSELWSLVYLNFSANSFVGGFPVGVLNLNQLRVLDLHSNGLWGNIGDLLSQLRNAKYVDLSDNGFYGGFSIGAQNISSLANTVNYLNLSHNSLNETFFDGESILLFRSLAVLDMSDNQIIGELPSFGSLPNLRILRLGSNNLTGLIPEELFSTSMRLEELDLSGNGFTGPILGINSTSLNVLNLSSNSLSGQLPALVKSCVVLDLSRNTISGDISVLENWETTLEVLDLSSNKISGRLPQLNGQFERLGILNLSTNRLVGSLPSTLSSLPRLSAVDISSNDLDGSIPASFLASLTLARLNLSGNRITGPIPLQGSSVSELLVKPSDLLIEYLDLSDNSLVGGLPPEISKLGNLKLLNLANNKLAGSLPYQLNQLSYLEFLDISSNNFTGKIPENLSSSLRVFNVSYNDLSGTVPTNLRKFPPSSFHPGNSFLILPLPSTSSSSDLIHGHGEHHNLRGSIRVAIIIASIGAAVMIAFVLLAYHRGQRKDLDGRTEKVRNEKLGGSRRPSDVQPPRTSTGVPNNLLLNSSSWSLSAKVEISPEISEHAITGPGAVTVSALPNPNVPDDYPATSGRKSSSSTLSSSPRFIGAYAQSSMLDVKSPDRLAGQLFFLDNSIAFTAEELSHAPAEVIGRSSHGTLYKATLDSGPTLAVKWLRVGLVKSKKEFSKEVKRIGSVRHTNFVPLRAFYWGTKEQERLLLSDYIHGDSLALHLYETSPRRYPPLSFNQRLKVALEVARSLQFLHDRGLPHGNIKPTNILLAGDEYNTCLTDYCLHRLVTATGIAEQMLNLGALGYCAPELASSAKPVPSFKADIYAFGVILMELITRRSAGDIISGQSGAVDLTDWVRLCDQEGRRTDCIDRDIVGGGEESLKAMDELLGLSLWCVLPVNERPNIRQVLDHLHAISGC